MPVRIYVNINNFRQFNINHRRTKYAFLFRTSLCYLNNTYNDVKTSPNEIQTVLKRIQKMTDASRKGVHVSGSDFDEEVVRLKDLIGKHGDVKKWKTFQRITFSIDFFGCYLMLPLFFLCMFIWILQFGIK